MGRFRLSSNKEKIKAAARSTKESAQSSNLKRKEGDSMSHPDPSIQRKRSNTPQGVLVDSKMPSAPSSMVIEASGGKREDVIGAIVVHCPASLPVRLSPFFDAIKKTFTKSSVNVVEGPPDVEQML